MRDDPASPFVSGQAYPYPTGDSPNGANCLNALRVGNGNPSDKRDFSNHLTRGDENAPVGIVGVGVNVFSRGALMSRNGLVLIRSK